MANIRLIALICIHRKDADGKQLPAKFTRQLVETNRANGTLLPKIEEPDNATRFYLRYTENGKRRDEPVGTVFQTAVDLLKQRQEDRFLLNHGISRPNPTPVEGRTRIMEGVAAFIAQKKADNMRASTIVSYTRAVEIFQQVCAANRVDWMDQLKDNKNLIHKFIAWMRENVKTRMAGDRQDVTVRNRLAYVRAFYSFHELQFPLKKKNWPRVVEKEVEAYTLKEINAIQHKATVDEKDLIQFCLYSGFRDDEVGNAMYSDIDFAAKTLNIQPRPGMDFTTKSGKGREKDIPLPAHFVARMKKRMKRNPSVKLIFPNTLGGPDSCVLKRVREAAERGGALHLIAKGTAGIHKFRKTFGTWWTARTTVTNVAAMMGHKDTRTTLAHYVAKTHVGHELAEDFSAGVSR